MAFEFPLYWINAEDTIPGILDLINSALKRPVELHSNVEEEVALTFQQNVENDSYPDRPIYRGRRTFLEWINTFFQKKDERAIFDARFIDPYSVIRQNQIKLEQRERRLKKEEKLFLFDRIEVAGDYRRLKDLVNSLDFLVATDYAEDFLFELSELPFVRRVMGKDDDLLTIVLRPDFFQLNHPQNFSGLYLNFYTVPKTSFGLASLYYNSDKAYWFFLKEQAQRQKMRIEKNGLFFEQQQLNMPDEASVFKALKVAPLPPEVRDESNREYWNGGCPHLLMRRDLQGDLHLHSNFSDGDATIEEMANTAISRGLKYIAMTDHSKNVTVARGMNAEEILQYWQSIDRINRQMEFRSINFRILRGVEVDILSNGDLDLSDEVLSQADWVVASMHFGIDQTQEEIHQRFVKAMQNRYVSVIGHPTNRILNLRSGVLVDIDFLCSEAARYGKFLELNSQPRRLDLSSQHCQIAKKYGVPVVISSDSHDPEQISFLKYGVNVARHAGLSPDNIVNTVSWQEVLKRRARQISMG